LFRAVTLAAIFGCGGPSLGEEERAFFAAERPWGFVLFARNIEGPAQIAGLVAALRDCVGRADAPVFVDQEGGRVQRLAPPHWNRFPAAAAYGELALTDRPLAEEMAHLGARLIANDLHGLGLSGANFPVLDVARPKTHRVIGDRAYSADPTLVARLGRAAALGLVAGAVLPVIKHIPGHGRARVDSHTSLPIVEAAFAELEGRDLVPFQALADMPVAMTAHVVYAAVDAHLPATLSPAVIDRLIRGGIGFEGLLVTDDLAMGALAGSLEERASQSLAAGCDVVLHCSGKLDEMRCVAAGARSLDGAAAARAHQALRLIAKPPEPFDAYQARRRFDRALGDRWAA
jgi:beta-N-acetylhexosaminidase